jgi:hypothetical protein
VDDEKADKMRALLQSWGSKKDRTPKVAAKDIETSLGWCRRNNVSVDWAGGDESMFPSTPKNSQENFSFMKIVWKM